MSSQGVGVSLYIANRLHSPVAKGGVWGGGEGNCHNSPVAKRGVKEGWVGGCHNSPVAKGGVGGGGGGGIVTTHL